MDHCADDPIAETGMPELQHIVRVEMELGRRGFDLVDDDLLAKSDSLSLTTSAFVNAAPAGGFSELPVPVGGALAARSGAWRGTRLHDL